MIQTILHLSDTHNCHHMLTDLPKADLIVHSGDFTFGGSEEEAFDFIEWFQALPYRYKLFVAGNHDNCLYQGELSGLADNTYYLCHSAVEIEGLKFYGMPMFIEDSAQGNDEALVQQIPVDTDVLITHRPPYGIFDYSQDRHWGSEELLLKVNEVRPLVHLFGHIHGEYGCQTINDTLFANSAVVNEQYDLYQGAQLITLPTL